MSGERRRKIERAITVALREAVKAHGPIDGELVGSAAKRVYGTLLSGGFLADPDAPLGPE